jgi:hypothetical protein
VAVAGRGSKPAKVALAGRAEDFANRDFENISGDLRRQRLTGRGIRPNLLNKTQLPQIAAATEPAKVPIFDMSSRLPSPKAKIAMNSDMVNPMPQSQLAPKICPQETVAGRVANLALVAAQANSEIPMGLPRKSPSATPKLTEFFAAAATFPRMCTPALEKANIGITKKTTHG